MATYVYTCPSCGSDRETPERAAQRHDRCGYYDKRNYQAEAVGFTGLAEMKRQRETGLDGLSGKKAQRDLFLPTARDMAKPGDRDGQKGLREWAERHGPRESNKKPLYPDMDKRVF